MTVNGRWCNFGLANVNDFARSKRALQKITIEDCVNVCALFNSDCNYLGGPLIWAIVLHEQMCYRRISNTCHLVGTNTMNLAWYQKLWQIVKCIQRRNVSTHSLLACNQLSGSAMPVSNSQVYIPNHAI